MLPCSSSIKYTRILVTDIGFTYIFKITVEFSGTQVFCLFLRIACVFIFRIKLLFWYFVFLFLKALLELKHKYLSLETAREQVIDTCICFILRMGTSTAIFVSDLLCLILHLYLECNCCFCSILFAFISTLLPDFEEKTPVNIFNWITMQTLHTKASAI